MSNINQTNTSKELRFAFSDNWVRFLTVLDDDPVQQAEYSLREMLQVEHLNGKYSLGIAGPAACYSVLLLADWM